MSSASNSNYRITLDNTRSTWTCFCCSLSANAPRGVSQCPTCGGVRFNHAAKKVWHRRILAAVRKRADRP